MQNMNEILITQTLSESFFTILCLPRVFRIIPSTRMTPRCSIYQLRSCAGIWMHLAVTQRLMNEPMGAACKGPPYFPLPAVLSSTRISHTQFLFRYHSDCAGDLTNAMASMWCCKPSVWDGSLPYTNTDTGFHPQEQESILSRNQMTDLQTIWIVYTWKEFNRGYFKFS